MSSSPELLVRIEAAKRAVLAQADFLHREFGRARSEWKSDGTRVTAADIAISEAIFRELDDQAAIALSVYNLGVIAERQGDFARAAETLEQSLDLHQRLGDTDRVAMSLYFLGLVASGQGDVEGSLQLIAT